MAPLCDTGDEHILAQVFDVVEGCLKKYDENLPNQLEWIKRYDAGGGGYYKWTFREL